MSENKKNTEKQTFEVAHCRCRHRFGAGNSIRSFVDWRKSPAAFGYSYPAGYLHSANSRNGENRAAQHNIKPTRSPNLNRRGDLRFQKFISGRFPLWAPYQYGGVPFVWPKYSLFLLLECCTRSPVILAWAQLFAALVAGTGMYFFCRKTLRVTFWPAAVCAWCYPLTAFFVLWQGFPTTLAVYWLPWIFWSVDKTILGASPLAAIGLSVVTFLVLTSGHIDVAGQVLLGSGIYAIWCLWDAHPGGWFGRKFRTAAGLLILGWGLGFLLAAPHLLPLLEYAQSGSRMAHRSEGVEERPPVGLAALPQVVLPDMYGTTGKGSTFIPPGTEPIHWKARPPHTPVFSPRCWSPLWLGAAGVIAPSMRFGFFSRSSVLAGLLNVPVFVDLLRLPGLNMMSHNRLVFLTSFAILALTATGLETLFRGPIQRCWWFWLPAVLLAALCGWCAYRSIVLPEPITTQTKFDAFYQEMWGVIQITTDVEQIQAWFTRHYIIMAVLCGLGFWDGCFYGFNRPGVFVWLPVLVIFLMGDLLWFDYGRNTQCDPRFIIRRFRPWMRSPNLFPAGSLALIVCPHRLP